MEKWKVTVSSPGRLSGVSAIADMASGDVTDFELSSGFESLSITSDGFSHLNKFIISDIFEGSTIFLFACLTITPSSAELKPMDLPFW